VTSEVGWLGMSTALKILREMVAEGLVSTETDQEDRTATLVTPNG
jgi:DNA-binding MarR family transcriptional regulator